MYLSRVELNLRRKNTMEALASPQRLHAAVESSFPFNEKKDNRNLWRIDRLGNAMYLLLLSGTKPDFSHIVDQFGWPGAEQKWETKSIAPLMEQIETGQHWRFRLRANPVHSIKATADVGTPKPSRRGKVYAHVTAQQQEQWLLERASKYGFNLQKDAFCVVQQEVKKFYRSGKPITLGVATYEGILEVADVALFLNTLSNGIGRAKAYGCGLLTITRITP